MATLSKVRWVRVLMAVVATHVANVVLSMVLIVAYSLLAVGTRGHPDGGSVDRFASLFSTWPIPVLTLVAAIWAARGTRPDMTVWHGLAVGLLVAMSGSALIFGLNHAISVVFLATVVLGLLLALAYERSGSIWPGVVGHILYNLLVFSAARLLL